MAKITYRARLLRFELQQKEAREVTIQEVAEATGMDRYRVSRIEQGKIKEIKPDELSALCAYYSQRLGRLVDTNEIMGFDPNNRKAPSQVMALQP